MNKQDQSSSAPGNHGDAQSTPEGGTPPWTDFTAKQQAFLQVMRDIIRNPELRAKYLKNDADAAQAFREAGIDVPSDVKVVFLPEGDGDKPELGAGSAVIQLPPKDADNISDDELLDLFSCTYTLRW